MMSEIQIRHHFYVKKKDVRSKKDLFKLKLEKKFKSKIFNEEGVVPARVSVDLCESPDCQHTEDPWTAEHWIAEGVIRADING